MRVQCEDCGRIITTDRSENEIEDLWCSVCDNDPGSLDIIEDELGLKITRAEYNAEDRNADIPIVDVPHIDFDPEAKTIFD